MEIICSVTLILKLLAPYFAVGVFWCVFKNAWLAILAYHAQVLLWSCKSWPSFRLPQNKIMLLALPTVIAGPVLYFLLPYITHTPLADWLVEYKLTGVSLMVMVPYFGILHPVIEQIHWSKLREKTQLAHFLFAGYHMMVLISLLTIPWLIVCFIVLATASFAWQQMALLRSYGASKGKQGSGSLALPVASHVLADLGVVIVAWMLR